MDNAATIFESHRRRLLGIGYRMLGGSADAEDLVQEAYLRWHEASSPDIESPTAFLVTVTKRLCLDRLRELKQQRVVYLDGPLPEAVDEDRAPSPETQLLSIEALSAGFLKVNERLGPVERAAFLLYDMFDYDHREVAQILRKSEQACRQTLHRARERLREPRARYEVASQSPEYQALLKAFLVAIETGDRYAVATLLAEMGFSSHSSNHARKEPSWNRSHTPSKSPTRSFETPSVSAFAPRF